MWAVFFVSLLLGVGRLCIHTKTLHIKAICNCSSTRHNSYYVLHLQAQKAISCNSTNSEVNMAVEWTDRQTICQLWLGLTGGVIEEDRASEVCHAISTHIAWRNSKLSHPGGQKHSGCKTLTAYAHLHQTPPPNTHTHTRAYILFACWLWILQIRVQSSSEGLVIGR